jgi:nucleotide-binding universal stress UspA family protein
MFRYILIPATGAPTDAPVFAAALEMARRDGGHIKFLHTRPNVDTIVAAMAASDLGGGGAGLDDIIRSLETDIAGKETAAQTAFQEFCEREKVAVGSAVSGPSPSAEFVVETGDEATYLAEHGRVADLIVAGRPREGETVAFDVLEVSLLHTGRPVLIVPAVLPAQRSGTVVIAWKNKPEAARAVAAAQPLVAAAKKVIILAVEEGSGTAEPSCKRLRAALLWHNPNTSIERLTQDSRPCAEVVLDAAMAAEADVLVMGGYGHSRVREVIFGGVTEHVLAGAAVPVFMVH